MAEGRSNSPARISVNGRLASLVVKSPFRECQAALTLAARRDNKMRERVAETITYFSHGMQQNGD
jgi:hypothetical protein